VKRHRRLPFGAELAQGGVRFRVWAPAARRVGCRIAGAMPTTLPMRPAPGGWFELTTALAGAGTRYQYDVDGVLVPDPASRFQPEDVGGPSEVIDPEDFHWSDPSWAGRPWEEMVLYELHTGAFCPTGDFAGIAGRLDHLVDLGVTGIELMPVADFPGRWNWGYDGVLLFAPDHRYGRPDDLKRLVALCHARGLAILLDVVYNHFGPEGNYLHLYAPQFFTDRHQTPWGAAIDFDGPSARPVRDFFVENALYWLEEYHFDGLRLDAVHAIRDGSASDILNEIAAAVRAALDATRAIHLVLENDRNEARYLGRANGAPRAFTAQWDDDWHHALHVAATGASGSYYDDYVDHPARHLGRALAEGFAYQGEASVHRGGAARGEPSPELPPTAFVSFLQNHDQVGNDAYGRRLSRLAGDATLHAASAILLLSPQIPLLFMGEEWGAVQPFYFFCDFSGDLAAAVRDGRRRGFARILEFLDPGAPEPIADPIAETTFLRSVLDWRARAHPDHARIAERHRTLLALRRREIVPRLAGITGRCASWRELGDRAVLVSWRLGDGSTLELAANFSSAAVLASGIRRPGRCLYATAPDAGGADLPPASATFVLAAGVRDER